MMSLIFRHSVLYLWIAFLFAGVSVIADVIHVGPSLETFDGARLYCLLQGGELLSIHSNEAQEVAGNLCNSTTSGCWIGLHQPEPSVSDNWEWTDGSDTDYGFVNGETSDAYPWGTNEPNHLYGDNWSEDCVQLLSSNDYRWNDKSCLNKNYPMCAFPTPDPTRDASASPTAHPTFSPTAYPTTNPTTDPTENPTTDQTTRHPSTPPTAPSSADAIHVGPSTMGFEEAHQYCQSQSGELLSIHSYHTQKEAESLCSTVNHTALGSNGCWIGLYLSETEGWAWTDGSDINDFGFNDAGPKTGEYPWIGEEPNNSNDAEDCVHLSYKTGYYWNDNWCGGKNIPLCGMLFVHCSSCTCVADVATWFWSGFPTSAPTNDPTISPTFDPTSSPTNLPTTEPSVSPSHVPSSTPSNHPTTSPSDAPTNFPSISPTAAPSRSPTQHPITYSDFQSSATAFFKITGWTNSEISDVDDDIQLFAESLTMYIHQGFDNDDSLEYQHLVLKMRLMNGFSLNYLSNESASDSGNVLWQSIDDGMDLQYLINCSSSTRCIYIESDDPENGLNDTVFEAFVSDKLNSHFISTDTQEGHNLNFKVEGITMDAMESSTGSSASSINLFVVLIVCGVVCVFVSGASVGVIALHCKQRKRNAARNASNLEHQNDHGKIASGSEEHSMERRVSRKTTLTQISQMETPNVDDEEQEGMQFETGAVIYNTEGDAGEERIGDVNLYQMSQSTMTIPGQSQSDENESQVAENVDDDRDHSNDSI